MTSPILTLSRRLLCGGWLALLAGSIGGPALLAAPKDPVATFIDHGVAAPYSNHRGTVATVDANGREVVLLWLMDHRGGHSLLLIDAATGKSEQFALPFPIPGRSVDSPYASLLSSRNRFYTLFGDHFVEFDVMKRAITFSHATTPRFAMGMTEDDQGVIWAVNYPQSGVVSYNPATGAFRDYGEVHHEEWPQYQRFVAADDAGWIYFGLGTTASQIVAFNPATGKATPMLPEAERKNGIAYLYRDLDGKVYGQARRDVQEDWYVFHQGEGRKIGRRTAAGASRLAVENVTTLGHARGVADDNPSAKPVITGDQALFHPFFPSGKKIKECNLIERKLTIEDPDGNRTTTVAFDYDTDGALIMGVATTPDGKAGGGTTFPDRFFAYDAKSDAWDRRPAYGQWNTLATQAGRFFAAGYGGGFLLEWNPARAWVNTTKGSADCNPAYLTECTPEIHRPHILLPLPDRRTLVMGGTPAYGYTGGGLLFYDIEKRTRVLLTDQQVIPQQSTASLVVLPDGRLFGGSTTTPGTGGKKEAAAAELYIMDPVTQKLAWHEAALPGVQEIVDLCLGPAGKTIFGVADRKTFFVFDLAQRAVVYQRDLAEVYGEVVYQQGQRAFVKGRNHAIYLLVNKSVLRLDPSSFALTRVAEAPVPISAGGDYLDGRIYFAAGSHLCSIAVD